MTKSSHSVINLYSHQLSVLKKMFNGCVLNGDVGSGKSLTGISYYYLLYGGSIGYLSGGEFKPINDSAPPLYIITTAKNRDRGQWLDELAPFSIEATIDSWNNIVKYKDITNAFFIFDEQRAVGRGPWGMTFVRIAKANKWIMLSATPGDNWLDFANIFIANNLYKNISEFRRLHVVFKSYLTYPVVDYYVNEDVLYQLKHAILVDMEDLRKTVRHDIDIYCKYDKKEYVRAVRTRWNEEKAQPFMNASELCQYLRRIVNSDISRQLQLLTLLQKHDKVIVFYNYNYELDILKALCEEHGYAYSEWNGKKHQEILDSDHWVYLVQYTAGAEGWNCIETDAMIFYSQNYSHKIMHQARGRIDRINTPYIDLYYYHLKSDSAIDKAIQRALDDKKKFNEKKFVK